MIIDYCHLNFKFINLLFDEDNKVNDYSSLINN